MPDLCGFASHPRPTAEIVLLAVGAGAGGLGGAVEALLGMGQGKGYEGWAQAPINLTDGRVRSCRRIESGIGRS